MYFLVLNSVIGRKEPQFSRLGDSLKQDAWRAGVYQTFTRRRELTGYKVGEVPQKFLLFIYP